MSTESKISELGADELEAWDPSQLEELPLSEVRLGRGFLRADLRTFFGNVTTDWVPLFHSLGGRVELLDLSVSLTFPGDLSRLTTFEAEGTLNVIGMDDNAQAAVASMIDPEVQGVKAGLVLEYLERRLIASLSRHWTGPGVLDCFYHLSEIVEEVEVVGAIRCQLKINSEPVEIWFGLSPKVIEKIDLSWREYVLQQALEGQSQEEFDDAVSRVSVELAEISVSPVTLIDYMRSGTIIELSAPVSNRVRVRLDGELWAEGVLTRFNGRFAVKLTSFDIDTPPPAAGQTRVLIEVGSAELDSQSVFEHQQVGVCLLLATPVRPNASLIISGENVASAVIGQINDQFALNILPK